MSTRRYSIRRRLVNRTMACMLLVLGAISLTAHFYARHESQEFFSARLASSARVLEVLAAHQLETATVAAPIVVPIPKEVGYGDSASAFGHFYEHKIAFQIWSVDGRMLARSTSAPEGALAPLAAGFSTTRLDEELWQVFTLRSGRVWVQVAENDEVREEMVDQLGTSVLVPVLLGSLLLIVAVNLILSSNLRPIRALAEGIARREPESLLPVELPGMPDELIPVVDELNSLLARMRRALEREQQFIDAAAHEIRTPIAAVQLHVQNALRAEDPAERDASLAEAVAALKRATLLAEQLLTFSRLASKSDLALRERVSLAAVCREVIALAEPLLARRGQRLQLQVREDAWVLGDAYRLQQLVRNLVDNASQHGAPQGEIRLAVWRTGAQAMLEVANDGEPVPEEETARIFQPYYRIHPGASMGGAGLGLSIVREIALQHAAQVSLGRKPDGQGCVVTVALPLAQDGPDQDGPRPRRSGARALSPGAPASARDRDAGSPGLPGPR